MNVSHFLLNCYFSLVLGVAGIAKIDSPKTFFATLCYRYNIPEHESEWISRIFPWGELLVAVALLIPIYIFHVIMIGITFFLFFLFLSLNIISHYTHKFDECGCYGKSLKKRGITISLSTSLIQFILSMSLFLTAIWSHPLPMFYYMLNTVLFITLFSLLLWRTWQRHQYSPQELKSSLSE